MRHSYITLLARSGVSPKMAQGLARHSDINLTMSRYTHISLHDQAAALAALPSLSLAKTEERQGPSKSSG
jgi:integrase